jgi:hypothetical protein
MSAGTFVSHCYVFAALAPSEHAAHGGKTGLVGFFGAVPFFFSCLALVALGLSVRSVQDLGARPGAGLSAWPLGVLAPAGFLLHQGFSHATGAGTIASLAGPAFLVGLALQIPLGLLAYLAARALLRAADRLGAALAARRSRTYPRRPRAARWALASSRPVVALVPTIGSPRAPPPAC